MRKFLFVVKEILIFVAIVSLAGAVLWDDISQKCHAENAPVTIDLQLEMPRLQAIIPELNLASAAAFAVNLDTQDVVIAKNENAVRSVASITKLMTAYVVLQQPDPDVDAIVTITKADIALAARAHRASQLRVGMHFTRERLLNLALMSSENVAAAALGRTTLPGGTPEFVAAMNKMALSLDMTKTSFVDPIGIGVENQSTASDLVRLVAAASEEPLVREFSTTKFEPIQLPTKSKHPVEYRNTDALVGFSDWNILTSKTGFTNAAGHCVVMSVEIQSQHYIVIVLGSPNNQQRAYDAIKIRQWLENGDTLTTEQAQPLSPYKFVLYKKGKPVKHRHHKSHTA